MEKFTAGILKYRHLEQFVALFSFLLISSFLHAQQGVHQQSTVYELPTDTLVKA